MKGGSFLLVRECTPRMRTVRLRVKWILVLVLSAQPPAAATGDEVDLALGAWGSASRHHLGLVPRT